MSAPVEKQLADRILLLEGKVTKKMGSLLGQKAIVEQKIKQALMAKDQIYQDYYDL